MPADQNVKEYDPETGAMITLLVGFASSVLTDIPEVTAYFKENQSIILESLSYSGAALMVGAMVFYGYHMTRQGGSDKTGKRDDHAKPHSKPRQT